MHNGLGRFVEESGEKYPCFPLSIGVSTITKLLVRIFKRFPAFFVVLELFGQLLLYVPISICRECPRSYTHNLRGNLRSMYFAPVLFHAILYAKEFFL